MISVLIVGGGVASFVAGIEIRERLPDARVTIVSDASETMLGGQLASWDEGGYPIEHGLHALFGWYDHILPRLRRIGALENFTRSHDHTYVHEKGRLHRFRPASWIASYQGFSGREKVELSVFLLKISRIIASVKMNGSDVLDQFDGFDLREFGRSHGLSEAIVTSSFFGQFYDGAFNVPNGLSAAVGLKTLVKYFDKPWHYYFNIPSRDAIIEPLRRHFVDTCGGSLELETRLQKLSYNEAGTRVASVELLDRRSQTVRHVVADEYVLALGLEDFKAVDLGTPGDDYEYFRNIRQLTTVSSVSLQAWFRDDPVPPQIDSLIGGLPQPFSIVCPMTRVRGVVARGRLPYEVMACGAEAEFEHLTDAELERTFMRSLGACGFVFPKHAGDKHVHIRRNREPFHRYLLTRPDELHLRPAAKSPIANLALAGAWIRNSLPLPCVDAAAESGITVAKRLARRVERARSGTDLGVFAGMPKAGPLVIQPPFRFGDTEGSFFLVDADADSIRAAVPPQLEVPAEACGKLLFGVFDHQQVSSDHDPSGSIYGYQEVLLAAFVREESQSALGGYGLFPVALYLNNDTAVAAGREVYGFPKKQADVDLSSTTLRVRRPGRPPGAGKGAVVSIELISASWQVGRAVTLQEKLVDQAFGAIATIAGLAKRSGLHGASSVPFYNHQTFVAPAGGTPARSAFSRLTFLPTSDLAITESRMLSHASLRVEASAVDPIHRFFPGGTASVARGVRLRFSFSMLDATIIPWRVAGLELQPSTTLKAARPRRSLLGGGAR